MFEKLREKMKKKKTKKKKKNNKGHKIDKAEISFADFGKFFEMVADFYLVVFLLRKNLENLLQ